MSWAAVIAGGAALAGSVVSATMGSETQGGGIGQQPVLTPGQQRLLNTLTNILGGELGQPGETVPGESDLQRQLFGALSGEETAGVGSPIQASSEYLDRLMTQDYDPAAGREYWEEAFQKPMMQQWEQEIMPSVAEKYAGTGAMSSSGFNRAMGTAAENMQTQMGGQLADILYKGREAHRGRQVQGAGLSQQLATLLSQAGREQRDIGLQQWESQQPWGNPWLSFLNQALGTRAFESYAQQPYQQQNALGALGQGIGTLGSMYAYKHM
ncbi:MAG: hypothetical protein ACLFUL_07600 [Desulfobacteraceae bacterium]